MRHTEIILQEQPEGKVTQHPVLFW